MKVVSSMVHQLVKYPFKDVIAIVYDNSAIYPPQGTTAPLLEIIHEEENVFLSGFSLAEARLVQTIMAEDDGNYVSTQSIYMMNKQGHIPGSGLERSGRWGGTVAKEVSHNPHAFGLGYKPIIADWQRKGEELRGRLKAKKPGR
ncbi:hypothetical protein ACSBR1_040249 [Camellia fascicularis]